LLCLLGFDVFEEQPLQISLPLGAPGKAAAQHFAQRRLGVDDSRVDGQTASLERKAFCPGRQTEPMADQIHQVGRVLSVMDGERRIEADAARVLAQQACTDAVESAGPGQRDGRGKRARSAWCGQYPLDAARHLARGPAREGEQKDAPGIGPAGDELRDAVRQRAGLARPGAGDDQQRRMRRWAAGDRQPDTPGGGGALCLVQFCQRIGGSARGVVVKSPHRLAWWSILWLSLPGVASSPAAATASTVPGGLRSRHAARGMASLRG
jgi:hypothetical protein